MNINAIIKTYGRFSTIYDAFFGLFFTKGRKDVISKMHLPAGSSVLEVGIGTGASLALYPKNIDITGIDLSRGMMDQAQQKIDSLALDNVQLVEMNAEELSFIDNSFSHVVAMYVASVSPNPDILLKELTRVCKPGGEIIFLNHFSEKNTWLSKVERSLSPLSLKIGFKPYFPLDDFKAHTQELEFCSIEKTNLMGYWTILRAKKKMASPITDSTAAEPAIFDGTIKHLEDGATASETTAATATKPITT